jgi:tellurite methyltransferase
MSSDSPEVDLAQRTMPEGYVAYHQSPVFDEHSLPKSLQHRHNTKDNTWAMVSVLEGRVTYVEEAAQGDRKRELSTSESQVIEPQKWHRLQLHGAARIQVEFYRQH